VSEVSRLRKVMSRDPKARLKVLQKSDGSYTSIKGETLDLHNMQIEIGKSFMALPQKYVNKKRLGKLHQNYSKSDSHPAKYFQIAKK
jgi:hypothetical protein